MWRLLLISMLSILVWVFPTSAQVLPFAEGEVDNNTPYVGEAIVYTLRIYTSDEIENSQIIEPSFFSFGRSRILSEPRLYTEAIDNINYSVIEQSYIIYPLRAGNVVIDPFRIDIPETPFSDAITVLSEAVEINVQAYPEPKPNSFVNGVGQFEITATVTPTTLNSGDALTLTVTITGSGNLEQLLAPIIPLPEDWRLFDGQTSYQQETLRFGTRVFEWTIITQGEGAITLPAIEFSYLNPQTGNYEMRSTTPFNLTLLSVSPAPDVTIQRTQIVLSPEPIPELLSPQTQTLPPTPPTWFWGIWLIPPLLTFIVWLVGRPKREVVRDTSKTRGGKRQSGNRPIKQLQTVLKDAHEQDPKIAYDDILSAIFTYLSKKFGQSVTIGNYQEMMVEYPQHYSDELTGCIEEASQGQYAPITYEDVKILSHRVLRVCAAIEKANT